MPAVSFTIDPTRIPLMGRRRPTNAYFRPLPPEVDESHIRPMLAPEVRAGDLIVAAFNGRPTPYRITRGATWVMVPYTADPAPWNQSCGCTTCVIAREVCDPAAAADSIVMARENGECDLWDGDDYALVVPRALLPVGAAPEQPDAQDIEWRRALLRATVLPRKAAPAYSVTLNGTTGAGIPWGIAMASAQKSIRNGAHITAHPGGAFTLTAPGGGRSVRFQPA
jgi:hypothetical protein